MNVYRSLPPDILEKSLQELDGIDWGEPPHPSNLVETCHRLRRVPLKDFADGDLRIMIGQGINLDHLVPLALDRVEEDPWLCASFYDGDMLWYLMSHREHWPTHSVEKSRFDKVIDRAVDIYLAVDPEDAEWMFDSHVVELLNAWKTGGTTSGSSWTRDSTCQ